MTLDCSDLPDGYPLLPVKPGFMNPPPKEDVEQDSVYYWWWTYMRLVPDYGPDHPLYKDFGDLGDDFRCWWWHNFILFAEEDQRIEALADVAYEDEDICVYYKPKQSTAKYQVYTKPDMNALGTTLLVHMAKIEHPELTNYELFVEMHRKSVFKFSYEQLPKPTDSPAEITNKKNVIGATISRYLRYAKAYIENVGKGVFPKKD